MNEKRARHPHVKDVLVVGGLGLTAAACIPLAQQVVTLAPQLNTTLTALAPRSQTETAIAISSPSSAVVPTRMDNTPTPPKLTVSPSKVAPSDTPPAVSATPATPGEKTPLPPPVSGLDNPAVKNELAAQNATTSISADNSIDLYTTDSKDNISIKPESVTLTYTTDASNPRIITTKDAAGKTYAFNPEKKGWFEVPEVQMDRTKTTEFTKIKRSFIEDGRASIVTALKYVENPTISNDAVSPEYWVNLGLDGNSKFVFLSNMQATGYSGFAHQAWPNESITPNFESKSKPFAWGPCWEVESETGGDNIMILSRIEKNPRDTNKDGTINLFYGFDKKTFQKLSVVVGGYTSLDIFVSYADRGQKGFAAILAPPETDANNKPFEWTPSKVFRGTNADKTNPVLAGLQVRGELISLFSQKEKENILKILSMFEMEVTSGNKIPFPVAPIGFLPEGLSRHILLTGFVD